MNSTEMAPKPFYEEPPQYSPNAQYQAPQQPNQPYQEGASMFLNISSDPIDPNFPQSADLYKKMFEKFGTNVVPPPDWIITDEGRCHWLRCDQNALMYFKTHEKEKLAELERVWNSTTCCATCCGSCGIDCVDYVDDIPLGSQRRAYRNVENFCCCMDCGLDAVIPFISPKNDDCCPHCCCPIFCGLVEARQKFVRRLNSSGIPFEESTCSSCCLMCCCNPCTVFQMYVTVDTAHLLRYGQHHQYSVENVPKNWTWMEVGEYQKWLDAQTKEPGQWIKYKNECRENPLHPYYILKENDEFNISYETEAGKDNLAWLRFELKWETMMDERMKMATRRKIFADWGDDAKAIKAHNKFWGATHQISGIEMK